MVSVMAGSVCKGFVLPRGVRGFEAFSAAEVSLGIYDSEEAAIMAVINQGKSP